MSDSASEPFVRPQAEDLIHRLSEPRRFIQVIAGPRQVGKTTLVLQATARSGLPTPLCERRSSDPAYGPLDRTTVGGGPPPGRSG